MNVKISRFITKEELRLIREGLFRVKAEAKSELINNVDNFAEKGFKLTDYTYQELLDVIKVSKNLYEELGKDGTEMGILVEQERTDKNGSSSISK